MKDIAKYAILGIIALSVSGCVFFQQEPEPSLTDAIAVWQHQDETWDIWYSVYDHDLDKWHVPGGDASAPISIETGDDHDPDVSSSGRTALAVWTKATGGNSIYYSIWNGRWSAPAMISSGDTETDPTVAMDPSGNALSVWVSGHDSLSFSYYTAGAGWGSAQRVPMSAMANASLPELAFNSREGLYYLIFTGNNGTLNGAYAAAYGPSRGWSGIEMLGNDSILDNDLPTGHRTGISAAESRDEVTALWPGAGGRLYSAKVITKSPIELDRGAMPDVAYDSADNPAGTYKREGAVVFKADVGSPGGLTSLSSLSGDDNRASLAFIRDRSVPLIVWWNRVAPPAQIYYSFYNGKNWIGPVPIDEELEGTFNRNPAVAAIGHAPNVFTELPSCGNGVFEFPWEQCESGRACADPNFLCRDCKCSEKPFYRISCAGNTLDSELSGGNSFDSEQFLCKDDCGDIDPGLACDAATCTCKRIFPEVPTNKSCVLNTISVHRTGANGFSNATMICRDDCKLADISLICNPQTCTCVQDLPATPPPPSPPSAPPPSAPPPVSPPPAPPPSAPPPAPAQICGNHEREGSEECDGIDDSACGAYSYCTPMCRCY